MKEVALALGGGGMRGLAHIGVIRCLEENGFRIAAIAGTSAGGLIGSMYAAGYSIDEVQNAGKLLVEHSSFRRSSHDKPSLLGVSGIAKTLKDMIGDKKIEDLRIPFAVTAVEIKNGKEIVITKGKVVDAVLSTIAIPGILPSQELDGNLLVDGGMLDPVPVKVAHWLKPGLPVLAVVLHKKPENCDSFRIPLPLPEKLPTPIAAQITKLRIVESLKIVTRAIEVATERLSDLNILLDKPDVIIQPLVGQYNLIDKGKSDVLVEEGYSTAKSQLDQIERACSVTRTLMRRIRGENRKPVVPDYWITQE